jgi:hypothetical protein
MLPYGRKAMNIAMSFDIAVSYAREAQTVILTPHGENFAWRCTFGELATVILAAAGEASRALTRMQVGLDSSADLDRAVAMVQERLRALGFRS